MVAAAAAAAAVCICLMCASINRMQSFDIVMYGRRWRVAVAVKVPSKDDGVSGCAVAASRAGVVRGDEAEAEAEGEAAEAEEAEGEAAEATTTVFFLK